MIEAVIFDCDGTLLDSMPHWHAMQDELARRAGATLTRQQLDLLNASTLHEAAKFFHEELGLGNSMWDVYKDAHQLLLHAYQYQVHARVGAVSLVRRLHDDGVVLGVVSSSPKAFLKAGLERAGIYDLFDEVSSAEDEQRSKTDPWFVSDVADRLDAVPACTWCIDDSVYALETMNRAGFMTVGIYDSDNAGTREDLRQVSDLYLEQLGDLDYEKFINAAAKSAPTEARLTAQNKTYHRVPFWARLQGGEAV